MLALFVDGALPTASADTRGSSGSYGLWSNEGSNEYCASLASDELDRSWASRDVVAY